MATSNNLKPLILGLIGSCALVGGYGAFAMGAKNGLFDGLHKSILKPESPYVPGHKFFIQHSFTGIPAIDGHLSTLTAIFICLIDGDKTWDITLSWWYLATNFLAGWCLLVLEGMRRGNVGKAVSWTGTMGAIFQNISYTVTVPIYLVIHLLTSPTARPSPSPSDTQPTTDLEASLIPLAAIISFVIPTVLMSLPSPTMVSPATHYTWLVIWQFFPIIQTVVQSALTNFVSRNSITTSAYKPKTTVTSTAVYRFVLLICVATHLALLEVTLIPAELVPKELSGSIRTMFEQATFFKTFIPVGFSSAPTLNRSNASVSSADMAAMVRYLLQWDAYGASVAILLWAVYLRRVAGDGVSWVTISGKVLFWTAVGGLVAPAAILLWERDEVAAERDETVEKKAL